MHITLTIIEETKKPHFKKTPEITPAAEMLDTHSKKCKNVQQNRGKPRYKKTGKILIFLTNLMVKKHKNIA